MLAKQATIEPNFGAGSTSNSGRYTTTDFYLAAFLKCVGYDLVDVRRAGRRCVFVFRDCEERHSDVLGFFRNTPMVPPLTFASAVKDLKALLHNT